ncbi:MAG: hypothetical protein JW715_03535 [Sedimentisphaerales bacterium]|nr:hypothetical protein [Sedimentisphaerales bacterium]
MEASSNTKTSRKIYADKLSKGAIVCVLLGVSLFVGSIVLAFITPNNIVQEVLSLELLVSIIFIYFVPQVFGIFALIDITVKWKTITNRDYILSNQERIYVIVKRFIIVSLLFSVVVLFTALLWWLSLGRMQGAIMQLSFCIWFTMALIAFVMALISHKLSRRISKEIPVRIGVIFSAILSVVAIVLGIRVTGYVDYLLQYMKYSTGTPTFSGSSDSLSQTIIIPTLDSPCPKNRNIIWCSSFQLAWNKIKDDVLVEPVQVVGAEELAARLNKSEQSFEDLEPDSFYAEAGRTKDGIIEKIHKEMTAKFPSHSVPDFNDIPDLIYTPDGILAYSYLIANVPFKYPYRQVEKEFFFTDSNGVKTNVAAFGVWGYDSRYKNMREQVEILFCHQDYKEINRDLQMKEFVVDLCRHSSPYQVVAAVLEPRASLEETFEYINNRIEDFKEDELYEHKRYLGGNDVLVLPEMFWEIDHRFEELLGKVVSNADPAMPIVEARQGIKFRLDRYGATLESESMIMVAAIPRYFRFNRPFLIYMKKRGCSQPFFVMWVDNAELLTKK